MPATPFTRAWICCLVLTATLVGCDDSNPVLPSPTPMPSSGSASFAISGAGQDQMYSFVNGSNTVLCTRNAGWASLFIRFAEQSTGGGTSGARLDMDLCNHAGGGTFSAKDPNSTVCGSAQTWDVFWHAADGSVFANQAGAMGCTLQISEVGSQLNGSFDCRGLVEQGGSRTVDVTTGVFNCSES